MARPKKYGTLKTLKLTITHIGELCSGNCYFRDGFCNDIEAMKVAWQDPDVKKKVFASFEKDKEIYAARIKPLLRPWAVEQFGL